MKDNDITKDTNIVNDTYYVTMKDAERVSFLLGPFTDACECKHYAYGSGGASEYEKHARLLDAVYKIDPKSHFYAFGMCKISRGTNRKGVLNRIDPIWDKVLK